MKDHSQMQSTANTILVVDDDEFQRDLIGLQLSNLGWNQVLLAANGSEALDQLDVHQQHICLIITDLMMPDMDGLVMMRHLAQRGFAGSMILLSGMQDEILSSAAGLASAHRLNVVGSLGKPCDPEQLRQLLGKLQSPSSSHQSGLEQALEPGRLNAAMAAGEFISWYQPKINLLNGKPVGTEALARWPQADGSMISPAVFVPALEAAGLADELFFTMAHQVTRAMAAWQAQGIFIKTAINMSMDTALNLTVPERLDDIVRGAGLSPSDFVIEVTESRLMVERSLAMESLTRLSLMGFALSIDDFGTGYSSLVQLIDLPFHELKIDGSFVQRSSTELKAQSVLCIAILLGINLDMEVVAEGVETLEQLEFLRNSGGTIVQGFYFARPMPLTTCTAWLLEKLAA